jgi:hypothetical protein
MLLSDGKVGSMRRVKLLSIFLALFLGVLLASSPTANAQIRNTEDDSTKIHRLHVLMNQGLIMFLDGIDMKMISNMKMSTSFDLKSEEYASQSMNKGRYAIELALRGEQNEILVEQGFGNHPLMKTARELGEAMLDLLTVLEKMEMGQMTSETMEIHHMHLLLNRGLEDVAQGSNMIMTTLLTSIPQIDQYLENQGWIMVKEGKTLIAEVIESKTYRRILKADNTSSENSLYVQTRKCADLSLKIADIISRMNIGSKSQ